LGVITSAAAGSPNTQHCTAASPDRRSRACLTACLTTCLTARKDAERQPAVQQGGPAAQQGSDTGVGAPAAFVATQTHCRSNACGCIAGKKEYINTLASASCHVLHVVVYWTAQEGRTLSRCSTGMRRVVQPYRWGNRLMIAGGTGRPTTSRGMLCSEFCSPSPAMQSHHHLRALVLPRARLARLRGALSR
jgi:hypothetical protein